MGNKLSNYNSIGERARKKIAILERKQEFPVNLRETIEEAKKDRPATFLRKIKRELRYFLLAPNTNNGLNDARDTENEVRTAITFFPDVLGDHVITKDYNRWLTCPVHILTYNSDAVSFIPLFAELGIEFCHFAKEERGGLITDPGNVLHALTLNPCFSRRCNEEYQQLVDKKHVAVMKRLRQNDLFKKEDIREYRLIWNSFCQNIFPEQRFRYLADWDPSVLMIPSSEYGSLPIHYAIHSADIHGFLRVFDAGMQHYPTKIGGLFHKNSGGETAFQLACEKYGNEKVEKILDDVLLLLLPSNHNDNHNNLFLTTLICAAKDKMVHMESVYILVRGEPGVLLQTQ